MGQQIQPRYLEVGVQAARQPIREAASDARVEVGWRDKNLWAERPPVVQRP